jgi:hypothetical protein
MFLGDADGVRPVAGSHLCDDVADVGFYRPWRDIQPVANLAVPTTLVN